MARVRVEGLTKRFGSTAVLDGISFTVEDGELFVLLGPSGCGKSTMLRIIAGLEEADAGSVLFNERNILGLPSRERNLGMVFQDYWLYPHMTVAENIAYGLDARGFNRNEISRRVAEVLDLLSLRGYADSGVTDLSGGEQQRVGLARAFVKDADAYLFDEPLSSLDAKLRNQMRQYIMQLHKRTGKATIYVTHDQLEAFALADRIAVMQKGRIMQIGTPRDIFDHPQNVFVARFVGLPPMNLFHCHLGGDTHEQRLAGLDLSWLCRDADCLRRLRASGQREFIIGVRPEDFALADEDPGAGGDDLQIAGTVKEISELAGEYEIVVTLPSGQNECVVVLRGSGEWLKKGDRVSLAAKPRSLHLFDAATEEVLPG
ncbi:MAG: ABC transporter ATP-binding protein [Patescibacteria group bacterium]